MTKAQLEREKADREAPALGDFQYSEPKSLTPREELWVRVQRRVEDSRPAHLQNRLEYGNRNSPERTGASATRLR